MSLAQAACSLTVVRAKVGSSATFQHSSFKGQALPSFRPAPAMAGLTQRKKSVTEAVSTSEDNTSVQGGASSSLPLKEIPGSYGLPFFGKLSDRLDYFWFQGTAKFFQSRIDKYGTVFRTNIPPGFTDSRVIMLCDQKSFPVLYDMDKVDKTDLFVGTFVPSLSLTGGYRVLPYLDPSEERHTKLKGFCFDILKENGTRFFPEFHKAIGEAYPVWEAGLAKDGKVDFKPECTQFTFDFLMRAIARHDPVGPGENTLGASGASNLTIWIALHLIPLAATGLPHIIDELFLHSFPLPSFPAKPGYDKILKFLDTYATDMLDLAVSKHGLEREDALHNLLFFICFNSHGGFNFIFPDFIQYVGNEGLGLQKEIADEVRAAVQANGGLNPKALADMPLVASVVYEVLRFAPPVPYQYGRVKKDFVFENHEASFQVKKGEILGGAQPNATRDPKVFDDPNTFKPKRFLGEEGQKLLQYVLWSNGPETSSPSIPNKQCAGKSFVITITQLFVAEFFQRYDSYEIQQPSSSAPVFTKLNVAASSN